jgi:drug/metabolite transporter (DMT)-like permease
MSTNGLLYALGAATTWGAVYTLDQIVLRAAPPLELLIINSVATTIIISPLMFSRRVIQSITSLSGETWLFILCSVALAALANFFIFSGIKRLGASTASLFEIAYPLFVVVFSYVVFQTKPHASFIIGAGLILAGSAIIIIAIA